MEMFFVTLTLVFRHSNKYEAFFDAEIKALFNYDILKLLSLLIVKALYFLFSSNATFLAFIKKKRCYV